MSSAYLVAADLSDAGRTETAGSLVTKLGELAQHRPGRTRPGCRDRPETDTDSMNINGGHDQL
ncbi:hypothetical protein [Nocardia sp. GAS34]|uniref:hypothetical protein n=1 Tax=unclassified Nocardia TaxID=2637762 RepID=UPI003D23828A